MPLSDNYAKIRNFQIYSIHRYRQIQYYYNKQRKQHSSCLFLRNIIIAVVIRSIVIGITSSTLDMHRVYLLKQNTELRLISMLIFEMCGQCKYKPRNIVINILFGVRCVCNGLDSIIYGGANICTIFSLVSLLRRCVILWYRMWAVFMLSLATLKTHIEFARFVCAVYLCERVYLEHL